MLSQLPKLGMSFFGLHAYPEGGPNAEPLVWIGRNGEFGPDGTVTASYPASWPDGRTAVFPATAPQVGQAVVVVPGPTGRSVGG
ncbi:MAG: hypothetical protein HZB39_12395 [Planctomycetes bacterium]|nr:hypothetical protein [Planctomycetota bacterium]